MMYMAAQASPSVEKPDPRAAQVMTWRLESLLRAGYDPDAAWLLATAPVDLHVAVKLIERGCTPTTAMLILL